MPVPDFSPGEVLTASAMDSIGLWLVKTQTIGTTVSSVTVNDAFSATYDQYLITIVGGSSSAAIRIRMALGATATGYYWGLNTSRYDNGGVVAVGGANAALWDYCGTGTSAGLDMHCVVRSPFLAKQTFFNAFFNSPETGAGTSGGTTSGQLNNSTSYTSFTLTTSVGTMTGGTIRVYGYRN